MTVFDNVAYGLRVRGLPRATIEDVERAAKAAGNYLSNVHFLRDEPREFSVKSIFPTEAELDAPELQPAVEARELVNA